MTKKNALNRIATSVQSASAKTSELIKNHRYRTTFRVGLQVLAASMILTPAMALADLDDEPQIVCFELVEQAEPELPVFDYAEPTKHDWTDDEINQVAKVLWAETGKGNTYREKEAICYLILNRTRHGDPFPEDIVSVCKQKGEFNRGKASNTNREIARECLDRYQSHLEGNFQPIDFPRDAVYMSRSNGHLNFYNINWEKVFEV